jgi:hypothetical protein
MDCVTVSRYTVHSANLSQNWSLFDFSAEKSPGAAGNMFEPIFRAASTAWPASHVL